jgi:hypothetical protein
MTISKRLKLENERVNKLKLENAQLKYALKASRAYADKLVDGIPYLPADIENLRAANTEMADELGMYNKIREAAFVLFSPHEFPGPFILRKAKLNEFSILNRNGEVVLRSINETFITFVFMFLNKLSADISASN